MINILVLEDDTVLNKSVCTYLPDYLRYYDARDQWL